MRLPHVLHVRRTAKITVPPVTSATVAANIGFATSIGDAKKGKQKFKRLTLNLLAGKCLNLIYTWLFRALTEKDTRCQRWLETAELDRKWTIFGQVSRIHEQVTQQCHCLVLRRSGLALKPQANFDKRSNPVSGLIHHDLDIYVVCHDHFERLVKCERWRRLQTAGVHRGP